MLLHLLAACDGTTETAKEAEPPYGMILAQDGQLYAGIARIDMSPEGFETFTDINGDNYFDGCVEDPLAERGGCDEPFDDANGNGYFDACYIAGFGSPRPAQSVHDPLYITALVLSLNGEYVAILGVDAIGILENRQRDLKDLLASEGFDRNRVIASASHTHQGPDTVGIWGDVTKNLSGTYTPYTEAYAQSARDAIQQAAASMVAVSPTVGVTMMSADPALNGEPFGGTNPDPSILGGLDDIRDPIITGDQVLAIALDGPDGARVATLFNASGHPEVVGDNNNALSSDYVGYARDWIEGQDGGIAIFTSSALGGMQSALGSTLPTLDDQGERITDGDGALVWDEDASGFEAAREWGILVGQAAEAALADAQPWDAISVRTAGFPVPVDNLDFKLAFSIGILDTPDSYVIQDSTCPGYTGYGNNFGCVPLEVNVIQLGPVTLGSVPGELFPELFWGIPDEAAMTDAAARATDRRWVQVDQDCAAIDWTTQCKDELQVVAPSDCDGDGTACDGMCDCLHSHVTPYILADDDATPIADLLPGTYKAPLGISNGYCGYIVPGPDFNTEASQFTDDGDHYEETNSCSKDFATYVLEGFHTATEN